VPGDMDPLRTLYAQHAFIFWIALVLLWAGTALWLLAVSRRAARAEARLDSIFSNVGDANTAQRLAEYLTTVRRTASDVQKVVKQHEEVMSILPTMIRHVGLVRFSPFHDTGSDQSFTLALLDGVGDGVVITGLHSRTDSRLYAKPIEAGESEYVLTPEERNAMDMAMRGRSVEAR
jgi:hypothetical protein